MTGLDLDFLSEVLIKDIMLVDIDMMRATPTDKGL